MKSLIAKSWEEQTLAERVRWMLEQRFSDSEIEIVTGAPGAEVARYREELAEQVHRERFGSRKAQRVYPLQGAIPC